MSGQKRFFVHSFEDILMCVFLSNFFFENFFRKNEWLLPIVLRMVSHARTPYCLSLWEPNKMPLLFQLLRFIHTCLFLLPPFIPSLSLFIWVFLSKSKIRLFSVFVCLMLFDATIRWINNQLSWWFFFLYAIRLLTAAEPYRVSLLDSLVFWRWSIRSFFSRAHHIRAHHIRVFICMNTIRWQTAVCITIIIFSYRVQLVILMTKSERTR